jgi:hypothetical protein
MGPRAGPVHVLLAGGLLAGVVGALLWPQPGSVLLGAALLALVGWLAGHDVARRTIRATGLPRFAAGCMLAGYAWLGVASAVWLLGPAVSGPRYDAVVHAVFLGFTVSMIMAHAPVILPAVLHRTLPYHPVLIAPVALLHASLVLRLWLGDAHGLAWTWRWGGVLNVAAVLLFVLLVAGALCGVGGVGDERHGAARDGAFGRCVTCRSWSGWRPWWPSRWRTRWSPPRGGCSSTSCCSERSATPSWCGVGTSPMRFCTPRRWPVTGGGSPSGCSC